MAGVSSPSTVANPSQGTVTDYELASFRDVIDGSNSIQNTTAGDWGYAAISTQTTTVVKSGIGQLGTIMVLGGTLGAITVYDNTAASGTVIAPTFTPATLAGGGPGVYVFNCSFSVGLTIVTGAGTALTVLYR